MYVLYNFLISYTKFEQSGATIPGMVGPVSNCNEEIPSIPQSSSITGTSPSDCLVSYQGHSLGGLTPLQRSCRCILYPQLTVSTIYATINCIQDKYVHIL